MRWLALLCWDPIVALDLADDCGKPDHGKLMGALAAAAFLGLALLGKLPSLGHTIAIGTLVFGWPAWRTFLKAKSVTSSEAVLRDEAALQVARNAVEPNLYEDDERGEP